MSKNNYTIWNNTVRRLSSLRNTILEGIKPLKHLTWPMEFYLIATIVIVVIFFLGLGIIMCIEPNREERIQELSKILKNAKVVTKKPNEGTLWKSYGDYIMIYFDNNKILYVKPKQLKK